MKPFSSVLIFAAALVAASAASAQSEAPTREPEPSQLGEILVQGRANTEIAQQFVATVGAPVSGRKLATWRNPICVGAVGMRGEPARVLIDRVSDWGHSLGLGVGGPGCKPNILIIAAENGDQTAQRLMATHRRIFHTGTSGTTASSAALRAFQTSGRPIRWWHASLPVNADTGHPAVRMRTQAPFPIDVIILRPADLGAYGLSAQPSLMRDGTSDDLQQAVVIVENSALDHADFMQVADYVALVALAQISPDVSPPAASILQLFDPTKTQPSTLTNWDRAYLHALYASPQDKASRGANEAMIASALLRVVNRETALNPEN